MSCHSSHTVGSAVCTIPEHSEVSHMRTDVLLHLLEKKKKPGMNEKTNPAEQRLI